VRIVLRYDLRVPEQFETSAQELYAAALEQATWADGHGFDLVSLTEHHGSEDGYDPSPIVVAAAVAARTERVRIALGVLLLPLYQPVKAAEDLAVLDILSAGRLEVIVGGGYRAQEFAMFGQELRKRPSLVERGVEVLKQAWSGEAFEWQGQQIKVTPRPVQRPRPPLLLGGSSPAAAERAARIADGFYPTDETLIDVYEAACARLGHTGRVERRLGPLFVHVTHDVEAAWAAIAPHALHETNSYGQWLAEAGSDAIYAETADADALRRSGSYAVVTPDECVALMHELEAAGSTVFGLHPLMGGLAPDVGWASLELFADVVLPTYRATRRV
jgi:alkanesulfonate monooxygenase SsuD/methylene tetrahydromethanopterin reductase-like flavin-dependent oxidoreductase (luciferase family)